MKKEIGVLFVCMGNICRSPAAEGILKHLVGQDPSLPIYIASCGIGNWYVGHPADYRMKEASTCRGIDLIGTAQQFRKHFFEQFDYILAADHEVLKHLHSQVELDKYKSKIFLMTEFSSHYKNQEVPDPYYGGKQGFDLVLDMLEESCKGLLSHIRSNLQT